MYKKVLKSDTHSQNVNEPLSIKNSSASVVLCQNVYVSEVEIHQEGVKKPSTSYDIVLRLLVNNFQ